MPLLRDSLRTRYSRARVTAPAICLISLALKDHGRDRTLKGLLALYAWP